MAGKSAAERAAEAAAAEQAAAGKAGTAGAVKVEEVRDGDATVRVEGNSGAAVAAAEALANGAGGPGVGAAQVARVVDGPAVHTAPVAGADPHGRHLGDRMGTFPRAGEMRAAEGMAFDRATPVAAVRRSGRDEILPLSAPVIDPASVPGQKLATAAAQVRRDRRSYKPGETFPIDYRAFTELTPIGAIEATPWHDLPDHEG